MGQIKKIQTVYETEKDREIERGLGNKYCRIMGYSVQVEQQGFLSPFDFKIIERINFNHVGWLEVKKKSGFFSKYEMIPINKWNFFLRASLPCFMMIERSNKAILFNMTEILESGKFWEREIKRRVDQPDASNRVVFFFSDFGRIVYYV